MDRMIAVRKIKSAPGFELSEVEVPTPGKNDLLVEVQACSMCGTDIHIYNWEPPWSTGRFIPPKTIGHEVCGKIIDKGSSVNGFDIGDLVSAESHIYCGECDQCKAGNGHICRNLKFFSIDTDGFFAKYAIIPVQNAWKSNGMKPEIATLQESMGNSVYTVMAQDVKDKDVVVSGCGPTGLFAIGIAKALGAGRIFAIAGTELHMSIAKKMHADRVVDRHKEDPLKVIMDETENKGADVVLEMSGAEPALQTALKVVKPTGFVTVLGLPTKDITIDVSKMIVLKNLTFRGIYGRKIWDTWKMTSHLLNSGLNIEPIITHRLKLEDFEQGIAAMKSGQCGKVVMFPK
ncbi:MAG: L-threonine 3-dehydrogenase [Candidatus Aenigmarchaeota archaeon]|nr:L-threonine 3-dehydrogenase [Candidatus Aenigmarchaeota archaeon]